jgi:hypothetical protein
MGAAMSVVRRRPEQPASAATRQPRPADPADGSLRLRDRSIRYANQAVLPVYVLHQTVIVAIGFYVVQWEMTTLAKYLLISFTTLLATLVLYDLGVRRTAVTRVLFGMRQRAAKEFVHARSCSHDSTFVGPKAGGKSAMELGRLPLCPLWETYGQREGRGLRGRVARRRTSSSAIPAPTGLGQSGSPPKLWSR